MPYDPKNRPVFLGTEANRTNPNRLTVGVLSVADQNDNNIPVIPKPPSPLQQALHIGKLIALVLSGIAGSIIAMEAQGVVLPLWLASLAKAILAIAVPLGIGSSGLGKKDAGAGPLKDLPPE